MTQQANFLTLCWEPLRKKNEICFVVLNEIAQCLNQLNIFLLSLKMKVAVIFFH